ncbi:MAG: AraC family transcriptional regulator [Spirochaetaceae bacterium]
MANRTYQLAIPEDDIKTDFGIRFIGINREKPPGLVTNHCGIPALFFLQIHSSGIINGQKTEKQATIIWLPGETHSFGSEENKWSHSWIKFIGQRAITIFNEYNIPLGQPFYLKRDQLFEKYTTQISEEIRPHVTPDIRIIENIYRNFLMEIERDLTEINTTLIPLNIQKVKDLLDTKYYKNMHLKDLSEECNLAPNYLTSEFKNYYGLSIINYLIQVRVFHAKMLLSNLKLNIGDVAREVGYEDIQHFSKLFKKHTGYSPSEFRKKVL